MLDGLRRIILSPPVKILAAVLVAWVLFAWFAVGPIVKWAAPRYVAAHGERVLTIDRAHFNPFRLSLEIEGARLTEPDGTALLAFQRFLADFEVSSLLRGAWTFREILLDAPSTLVALRADGSLNWADFIDDFTGDQPAPEPEDDSGPPRLLIDRLAVTRGMADFSDRKFADDFKTRISPIDFEVRELSTLPDETGRHQLQLRTEIGARLQWQGTLGLNPLAASGEVALADLVFERIWPYLEPRLAMAPPKGTGQLSFRYRLGYEGGSVAMVLEDIAATVDDLAIAGMGAAEPGIRIDTIALGGGRFDLQARSAGVESLDVGGGRIAARRGADGAIDIASWFSSPDDEGAGNGERGRGDGRAGDEARGADGERAGEEERPADDGRPAAAGDDAPTAASSKPAAATPAPSNSVSGTITPGTTGADAGDGAWRFDVGRVSLDDVALHYVDESFARPLTVDAERLRVGFGVSGAAGDDGPRATVEGLGAELSGVALAVEGIADPVLALAQATLEGGGFDLAERSISAEAIRLGGARLAAMRAADGAIAMLDAFAPASGATTGDAKDASQQDEEKDEGEADEPWRYRIGELALDGGEVALRDASVEPTAALHLTDIHVAIREISDDPAGKWPAEASFQVREGGRFEGSGSIVASEPSGEFELRLSDLGLGIAQPYLSEVARLRIAGGSLASAGRLRFGDDGFHYDGEAALTGLDLHELETGETLLGWKSLSTPKLVVNQGGLEIEEMQLDGLRLKLIILEDRSVNIAKVVGPAEKAEQEQVVEAAEEKGVKPEDSDDADPVFGIVVERLRLDDGDVEFADLSLALPFGTRIHELKGDLRSLSNDPDSAATIAIEGEVDEYGTAKAAGEINLFTPAEHTDATVEFRNVEMTKLTPYSATFAGRRIASGKLSLDLEYRIEDQQLRGENRIVMEQLTLGEKVDSESAPNLPLDLAVAILKDSQGRIDIGLPVSGSLEDPEFSLGDIVGKALLGLVTRVVTAPFRALGALLGVGDDDKLSQIGFDAGSVELPGSEREKLAKLAEGLGKRPGLALEIRPGFNREADGRALRGLQLRREVAARLGRAVKPGENPGPLAMSDGATRAALEALFIERFNAHELRQLLEAPARRPGAGEPAAGGPAGGERPAGGDTAGPDAGQAASSSPSDAYRRVFEALRDAEELDEARFVELGKQRGEAIRAELEANGLAGERISVAEPTEREVEDKSVLMALELDARAAAGAPAGSDAEKPVEKAADEPTEKPADEASDKPAGPTGKSAEPAQDEPRARQPSPSTQERDGQPPPEPAEEPVRRPTPTPPPASDPTATMLPG